MKQHTTTSRSAMNFKTTYILFGILLVVLGLFAFALWYDPTAREGATRYVLPGLREGEDNPKTDDVTKVEIARNESKETITFEKDADTGRWQITSPRTMRADSFAVTNLIQQLQGAVREEKTDEPGSLAAWGLEPPQAVVTITKKGKSHKLNIGNTNSSGELYVLDPANPKKPMVVKKSRLDSTLKRLDEFRDGDLLASAEGDVQAVALGKGKETAVALKKDGRGHWVYTKPQGYGEAETGPEETPAAGGTVRTPGSMSTVLANITNLKVEKTDKGSDFVADDVSDFAKYNLDPEKAEVLRIQVTRLDEAGKDSDGKIKTKAVEVALLVGISKETDEKSGKYYARLEGDTSVVKVSARNIDPLHKLVGDTGALRDRYLVHLDGQPSAIDIKNAYRTIQLRRTKGPKLPPELERMMGPGGGDRWTLWRDADTSLSVDPSLMQAPTALASVLRQKNLIDSFIERKEKADEQAQQERELGLDKPAAVVELWNEADGVKEDTADPTKPDEKRKKPSLKNEKEPTYRLTFGNVVNERDKELVVVKREAKNKDGKYDVTLVKISKLALDRAKDGPLAYMDKTLERFTDSGLPPWKGVTKVVIQRGKDVIEVAREKDDEPWKIVRPTDRAGRNAEASKVEGVLSAMNRLSAVRLVAEKAKDDAELDRDYGLKTPQARVEITIKKDDKPVTYTYDFGSEKDGTVYAKQSQRDTIFTVEKSVLSALPADVLDPVVFTLDVEKVKKVTLTGWQSFTGVPITLELERKDRTNWDVKKGPMGFNLDSGKVNRLLDDLRTTRAEKFVSFKSGPKAEHEFDLPKGGLVIELVVEGEAKPITLTIGKPDGDKGYFALSSRSEGDVFVLPKSIFDGPKSKPAYFSP